MVLPRAFARNHLAHPAIPGRSPRRRKNGEGSTGSSSLLPEGRNPWENADFREVANRGEEPVLLLTLFPQTPDEPNLG